MLPNFNRLALGAVSTGTKRGSMRNAAADAVLATPELVQQILHNIRGGTIKRACAAAEAWCKANKEHQSICDEDSEGWTTMTYAVFGKLGGGALGDDAAMRAAAEPPATYTRKGWFVALCGRYGRVLATHERQKFEQRRIAMLKARINDPELEIMELMGTPGDLSKETKRRIRELQREMDTNRQALQSYRQRYEAHARARVAMYRDFFVANSNAFDDDRYADLREHDAEIFGPRE